MDMVAKIYKINFKSDFVLTIQSDAGWAIPFCIKFWTGMPAQAYFAGFDGEEYRNCRMGDTSDKLVVLFDDHHLPIGDLQMQIAYHTTIEEFPTVQFDEVTNPVMVTTEIDGEEHQVMLDFTGETAPEIQFSLPAYANEAQRIANEQERERIFAEMQQAFSVIQRKSEAATEGAENVNAQLNGTILTVTNREGERTSSNVQGPAGGDGKGVPTGGTTGQILQKVSDNDYDTEWSNPPVSDVTSVNGQTGDVTITAQDLGAYQKPAGGIPAFDIASGVIPDVSNFVTASVNNLVNYYLKSETYTKAEVAALIGAIQQFHYEIYASTSDVTSPQSNVLYLIGPTGTGSDRYEEYVYDSTKQEPWIKIGDTSIDLSGYVTITALNTTLTDYTTTADLTTLLAGKQDTISDLSAIRSGASAGATAVQPASIANMEVTSNKVTAISDQSTNTQYPSAKAVYDFVGGALSKYVEHGTDDTNFMLTPNCFHIWGEVAALTLTLPSLLLPGYEFVFQFTSGATATALSLPSGLKWFTPYTVKDRTLYQVRILNGCASMQGVDISLAGDPYVDLGLPSGVKWAKRNIDITRDSGFTSSDYEYDCSFFSWGNIDGHNPTSSSSFSPWDWGGVNGSEPYYEGQVYGSTPGNTLTGNIPVDAEYDAARAILGSPWRMPTSSEYQELFNNTIFLDANGNEIPASTTNKLVTIEGIVGIRLASKINGNELFFPCSGLGNGSSRSHRGSYGYYWSATWYSARNARRLFFNSSGVNPQSGDSRYIGFAVRAVQ